MGNSLLYVLKSFLKESNIKIDSEELKVQFLSHPSYPSLHALTGVLNHFGIANAAVRLPLEEQILDELTPVFIAQIRSERGDKLVLVKKNADSYHATYSKGNKTSFSKEEFLDRFLGVVVVVEKENYDIKKSKRLSVKDYILTPFILFILLLQFLLYKPSIGSLVYLLLSFLGVIISYAIFKQEQGDSTIVGNAFCNSSDEKKDCNSVLNSKGANISKNFKLSDVCILYFIATTISIYTSQILDASFSLLHIISFLALPVTIYSVFYQKFVIKKWCALCLTVVAILWLQAVTIFLNKDFEVLITAGSALIVSASYLLTYLIWGYTSGLIRSNKKLYDLKIEFFKFKKNFNLFKIALQNSDSIDTYIPSNNEIKFGYINSNLKLVIVTNPFCGHCKAVHTLIEDILEKYSQSVQITVRFNVNINQKEGQAVAITSRIIELYNDAGEEACLNAMHDIYGDLKPEAWIEKWGKCKNLDKTYDVLQKNRDWCTAKALNFTPVILINGKEYPRAYNRADLIYFIEELDEGLEEVLELQNSMQ